MATSLVSSFSSVVSTSGLVHLRPKAARVSAARVVVSRKVPTLRPVATADVQKVAAASLAGCFVATLADAGSAQAAQEMMQIAASDSRGIALLAPLLLAVGWVAYNILNPALSQLDRMRKAKAVVAGLGLGGAAFLMAPSAEAAQEVMQLAEGDSRPLVLLLLIAPALGWVLFNILGPALNQLDRMKK